MACGCKKGSATYEWTSDDGATSKVYATAIQAKAKVLRDGGTWVQVPAKV